MSETTKRGGAVVTAAARRTTVRAKKTIYRECACGENAHDCSASKIDGRWYTVYLCRNCHARILGPAHRCEERMADMPEPVVPAKLDDEGGS